MQDKDIKEFISETAVLDPKFSIKKVENIKDFSLLIKNLIFELAVFEKMEIQCEITEPGLVIDYEWAKATKFNGKEVKDRFYELSVVTMEETCEKTGKKTEAVVGFAIYYLKYDMKSGLGFFLEDLYVKDEYRGCGLGTSLWRFVIRDILSKHKATYMQWTVLSWNTRAIDFYVKYKSRNLTTLNDTHFFRILRETIHI